MTADGALDLPTPRSVRRSSCVWTAECGGVRGRDEHGKPVDEIYYIGIIDILQQWNWKKKGELRFKRVWYTPYELSCVPPTTYAARFVEFMKQYSE